MGRRRERDVMRGWRECFRNSHCALDFPTATNGLGPRERGRPPLMGGGGRRGEEHPKEQHPQA